MPGGLVFCAMSCVVLFPCVSQLPAQHVAGGPDAAQTGGKQARMVIANVVLCQRHAETKYVVETMLAVNLKARE